LWRCFWPQGCERKAARKKFIVNVLMATGLWKEGSKKKKNCKRAYGHMTLWNFSLRFEPSGLPPLINMIENFKTNNKTI
jgi:hypothetical protein